MFNNAKQVIPAQFEEIMRNHREQATLKKKMFLEPNPTRESDWKELHRLRREMREYRRNAEKILKWNPTGNAK